MDMRKSNANNEFFCVILRISNNHRTKERELYMRIYDVSGAAYSNFTDKFFRNKTRIAETFEECMGLCQVLECYGRLDGDFVETKLGALAGKKSVLVKGDFTLERSGMEMLMQAQICCFGAERIDGDDRMRQELEFSNIRFLEGLELGDVLEGSYVLSLAPMVDADGKRSDARILLLEQDSLRISLPHGAELWQRAIEFATLAHKGAVRKGTKIPYIVHPVEASNIVYSLTDDLEIVAAAALHDVIEDTAYGYEDIKREFGVRVADFVQGASENKRRHMKAEDSWKIRKQEALEHMRTANLEEKMIALGDKLSNMRATNEAYAKLGDKVWERFNVKDKKMHAWYYCGARDALREFEDTEPWKEFDMLCKRVFG